MECGKCVFVFSPNHGVFLVNFEGTNLKHGENVSKMRFLKRVSNNLLTNLRSFIDVRNVQIHILPCKIKIQAISAYFTSKKILPFGFAEQYTALGPLRTARQPAL